MGINLNVKYPEGPDIFPELLVLKDHHKKALITLHHIFTYNSPIDKNIVKNLCHYYDIVFKEIRKLLEHPPNETKILQPYGIPHHAIVLKIARFMIDEINDKIFRRNRYYKNIDFTKWATIDYSSLLKVPEDSIQGSCYLDTFSNFVSLISMVDKYGVNLTDENLKQLLLKYPDFEN
jgi:hypothetical protein